MQEENTYHDMWFKDVLEPNHWNQCDFGILPKDLIQSEELVFLSWLEPIFTEDVVMFIDNDLTIAGIITMCGQSLLSHMMCNELSVRERYNETLVASEMGKHLNITEEHATKATQVMSFVMYPLEHRWNGVISSEPNKPNPRAVFYPFDKQLHIIRIFLSLSSVNHKYRKHMLHDFLDRMGITKIWKTLTKCKNICIPAEI